MRRFGALLASVVVCWSLATPASAAPAAAVNGGRTQEMGLHRDGFISDSNGNFIASFYADLAVNIATSVRDGAPSLVVTANGYGSYYSFLSQARDDFYLPVQEVDVSDVVAAPAGNTWSVHTSLLDSNNVARTVDIELSRPQFTYTEYPNPEQPGINAWIADAGNFEASSHSRIGVRRYLYTVKGNVSGYSIASPNPACSCFDTSAWSFDGVSATSKVNN